MITSSRAILLYTGIMVAAFVTTIVFPAAPFLAFTTQFTVGFVAYLTKRIVQKRQEYNGKNN